jgi:alkyldihydroxyacetonephosphate synthase
VSLAREALNWRGWGRPEEALRLTPARGEWLMAELSRRFGGRRPEARPARVGLSEVKLPEPRVGERALARLRQACGEDAVRSDAPTRAMHALGRSLPDLFRLRRGEIEVAPDVVVSPRDEQAVVAVLGVAGELGLAVIPIGGATSVVGGVEARSATGQAGAIALDTTRLDAVVSIDPAGGLATFGAGIDGPALEAALGARGLVLGHTPQSFEYSTLGGWIATRSAGQQSNGYGGIEDLVVSVRVVTPRGVLATRVVPRSATGPDLDELVLGSEGTLGVITEATLRVSPRPAHSRLRGMLFHRFADGVAATRELVRERTGMGLVRLSDEEETALARIQRRDPTRRLDPVELVFGGLSRLGYGPSSALLLYGGDSDDASALRRSLTRARAIGRAHGGFPLGGSPGRSWRHERFRTPYLRDWLLDRGVAADTFETAFPWSRLEMGHIAVRGAVAEAARRHAGAGIAMAHLSHSYLDGACLYFTVLYPVDASRDVSQWHEIKRDVTDAILAAGGTLSHHHGVGSDHRDWMPAEKGELGLAALRSLKASFDPAGIMNPGKLL